MKSLSLLSILLLEAIAANIVSTREFAYTDRHCGEACHYTEECNRDNIGAVRLTCPRNSNNEGAVQICASFTANIPNQFSIGWVYLGPGGWDEAAATVVCEQLGIPYTDVEAFNGTLPYNINAISEAVNCNGEEDNLRDCFGQVISTTFGADSQKIANVVCKCEEGSIRLVDGANHREGRVEVCVDGRWGTVCGKDWTEEDAGNVCEELGFSREVATLMRFGNGTGQIHTLTCSTSDDCTTAPAQNCHHGMDVGVRCLAQQDMVCTTDDNGGLTDNNTTIVALSAATALLVLVVLILAAGWILTCVLLIRKQSTKMVNIAKLASSSDRHQMDNPTYNGLVGSQPETQYSSLGPANEFIADTNSTHNYDVISRPLPCQQATPNGSHDPPAEHDYHVLEHSKSGSQSNPQDYATPMPTGN